MKLINWIKKHWVLLLAVVVLIGGGLMILKTARSYSNRTQPKLGPMVESVYGIGTVTARHTYQLKLGVSDTLQKLFIQEGDTVKKGQRLLSFMDNHVAFLDEKLLQGVGNAEF